VLPETAVTEIMPRLEAYVQTRQGAGFTALPSVEQARIEEVIRVSLTHLQLHIARAQAILDARITGPRVAVLQSLVTEAGALADDAAAALAS
jgi:hypothetical protein